LLRIQSYLEVGLILLTFYLVGRPPAVLGIRQVDLSRTALHSWISLAIFVVVYWVLTSLLSLNRSSHRTWPVWAEVWDLTRCILGALASMMAYQLLFHQESLGLTRFLVLYAAVLVVLVLARLAMRLSLRLIRAWGYNFRTMLIVGNGAGSASILERLRRYRGFGMKLVGFVTDDPEGLRSRHDIRGDDILGDTESLEEILREHPVDEIYIADRAEDRPELVRDIIRNCIDHGVLIHVVASAPPRVPGLRAVPARFADLGFYAFSLVSPRSLRMWVKRAVDVVVAATLLLLLSPLMLITALAVKLTSSGPVFFRQRRMTCGLEEFTLLKFRSMVADAEDRKATLTGSNESDGPVFKIRDDPRVTAVGRIIRRTSIDELPQLWNVLAGHMSLVGPRPLAVEELDEDFWWRKARLSVKPGLTGLWQINGRSTRFEDWVRYDLQYVENWSLREDLRILLKTIPAVFSGRGAA
jgi:exopolysaccharide biosynthesis polyprenyl glycosylphosphotransferase